MLAHVAARADRQPSAQLGADQLCHGSTMVTLGAGAAPEVVPSAIETVAELPELTAAAATLRPLASTAELASATMIRVRTTFMTANPSGAPPAH
jgi:hypothetical protein